MDRILDLILNLGMIPILCIGVFAIWDVGMVSKGAQVDNGLVELAQKDDAAVFEKIEVDSKYVIAWLSVDGTNINYPVVQGKDNDFFLNRNYKGEYATAGSLFLDYRNNKKFKDVFSIIYGHRMGNGEMFSDIHKFKAADFMAAHKAGKLKIRDRNYDLEIMAYAEVRANDWDIYNVEKSKNDIQVVEKILNDGGAGTRVTDGRYVLLSTCDGARKNLRNVLLARIVD